MNFWAQYKYTFFQRNKAPNEQAIPLLMPQQHMVIPHYRGSREFEVESKNSNVNQKDVKRLDSFSPRSSSQDIPLLLPQEADGMDASKGNPKSSGLNSSLDLLNHPSRVSKSLSFPFRKSKIESVVPDMPMKGFVDDHDTLNLQENMSLDAVAQPGVNTMDEEWWKIQERGNQVVSEDETGQVGPRSSCRCQVGSDY